MAIGRYVLAIGLILPTIAAAQDRGSARVGDRVRISAPESGYETIVGRVVGTDLQQIRIRVARTEGLYYIPRTQIVELEVSSSRRRHALGGAVVGGLNGILLGIGLAGRRVAENAAGTEESFRATTAQGAMMGGGAGMLIGGFAGFLYQTDDWRRAPIEDSPVSAGRSRTSSPAMFGIAIRF